MMRYRVPLLLAVLAAGCTPPAPPPSDPAPLRVPSSPYYPLKIGTRWLYKGGDHQLEVRVVKHVKVNGKPCAQLESYRDGTRVAREHIFAANDGVYRLSADGKVFNPPLALLKLPAQRGLRWTVTFEQQQPVMRGVFEMGAEEVDVAYSSFADDTPVRDRRKALTLQGEIIEGDISTVRFRYWYVWDVGIVKQVLKLRDRTVEYELIKFEKP
jgi:hypothetical protein